jgi:excisionase family DNA binding protein
MTEQPEPLPIAVTVPTARRISGIGRTKLYELIAEGKLVAPKIGRRRLINFASLQALIADSVA